MLYSWAGLGGKTKSLLPQPELGYSLHLSALFMLPVPESPLFPFFAKGDGPCCLL